jgi:hypothetical protein
MKLIFFKAVTVCFVLIFTFSSCATLPEPGQPLTPEQRQSAKIRCFTQYTVGGALSGAALGAVSQLISGGNVGKAAAIGAGAGAVAGFAVAWGKCFYLFSDVSSQPVEGYKAKTSKTYEVKIEDFSISPTTVYPGDYLSLNGSYIVTAPEGVNDLKVTETTILEFYDEKDKKFVETGRTPNELTVSAGILRKVDGNIEIPAQAEPGTFKISLMITSEGKTDKIAKEMGIKKKG